MNKYLILIELVNIKIMNVTLANGDQGKESTYYQVEICMYVSMDGLESATSESLNPRIWITNFVWFID